MTLPYPYRPQALTRPVRRCGRVAGSERHKPYWAAGAGRVRTSSAAGRSDSRAMAPLTARWVPWFVAVTGPSLVFGSDQVRGSIERWLCQNAARAAAAL